MVRHFVNSSMLTRCAELDSLFTKTYEDNTNGKLSDERFMMITKRYDEQLSLKKKISALQAEINAEEKRPVKQRQEKDHKEGLRK